ncbi:hypothetical protein [Plasticicumulans sp.]|uniref:hypothetical protein n=1 Tax=Plasticicumulans sp. TaxID=2307179 RepID=UPI002B92BB1E|nr:hypothetical protein [Plasticicumulans sp.]MBS0603147.1 hypothetical protein [Pseudomonadota bacterium]HMV38619.1 hypothetical protein [Plasticicumulans sp.]HMW42346.1 hypothetical protein [Plasticicumulans sp.]HNJ08545.1 hypothetical protein [Plasticicumulans sp.]HNM44204.1 hypothetical protein [Plasticicumulans sp.]
MATIEYSDLEFALNFADAGDGFENGAWFNRKTGVLWTCGDGQWHPEEPTEDLNQSADYAPAPSSGELDLVLPLVMSFAESRLPDHVDEIQEMFQHTGGWRNFKALLVRLNVESDWHACHQAATEKALRRWAAEEGFTVA